MAVFKCKMCGGSLDIVDKQSTVQCEYCGTTQTLPRLDDDRRANLYDRANHFRRNNEFDKAMAIYEQILNEDGTDAEAYWSLVLCRYGIEYVKDPASQMRVPTVNRAQFTSVFDDDNYKSALQYADAYQQKLYEAEAQAINEIQKGILAISQKEEPFDVFICYKETDANGRRTPDSVLANDLYYQLTNEGFKVFFSRITLEDKLGSAYEPYIFAALNSAKVMVVLGTQPEYFKAVWVRNEWSRYLALVKQSGGKKALIPAYKDMDPYDLPEEFSHLQAQDMGKLGFMQDLIRGIKKLVQTEEKPTVVQETVVVNEGNANIAPLLKRAFIFLEDGEWSSATEYCEKVLDSEPECAEAYLGKLMAELQCKTQEDMYKQKKPFNKHGNYQKAYRFGNENLKNTLDECTARLKEKAKEKRKKTKIICGVTAPLLCGILIASLLTLNNAYNTAVSVYEQGEYTKAYDLFTRLGAYRNSRAYALAASGDVVYGKYEQDGDSTNGAEDIEWIVLDIQGDKLLVISKYVLEYRCFNTNHDNGITYEGSDISNWLNSDFMDIAFSEEDSKSIDSVFLLTESDVRRYFATVDDKQCKDTQYVREKGNYMAWWLQDTYKYISTSGTGVKETYRAYYVAPIGRIATEGLSVDLPAGVRPAMWIAVGDIIE